MTTTGTGTGALGAMMTHHAALANGHLEAAAPQPRAEDAAPRASSVSSASRRSAASARLGAGDVA